MENYRFERVNKICEDLGALTVVQSVSIPEFQMKPGFFLTPAQADADSTPWQKFDAASDIWPGPDAH